MKKKKQEINKNHGFLRLLFIVIYCNSCIIEKENRLRIRRVKRERRSECNNYLTRCGLLTGLNITAHNRVRNKQNKQRSTKMDGKRSREARKQNIRVKSVQNHRLRI